MTAKESGQSKAVSVMQVTIKDTDRTRKLDIAGREGIIERETKQGFHIRVGHRKYHLSAEDIQFPPPPVHQPEVG